MPPKKMQLKHGAEKVHTKLAQKMTRTDSNLASDSDIAPVSELFGSGGPELAGLAWMGKVEASLHGSREALLALDLAAIEGRTREQAGLIREFEATRRGIALSDLARPPGLEPALETERKKELRRSAERILEAVRLQAALLARAQSKLGVLANMLAGPSIDYGRLLAQRNRRSPGWNWRRDQRSEIQERDKE